jgi:hypothetical protein
MKFISSEINRLFPIGWDKGYAGAVAGTCLRTSATLESSRREGGCRGLLLKGWDERAEFCKSAIDKYANPKKNVSLVRASIAKCDGKDRIVTVNSADMSYLSPYHTVMYDHISKQKWCLRGEATREEFKEFVRVNDEVFVSGDYESATDNLNLDVARHILNLIARRCTHIPLWIRDLGQRTLESTLMVGDQKRGFNFYEVKRGQMMGNALSFPLLCLQNYLAFKFSVPRDVPVRINGDDIVFRATRREYQTWANTVTGCGLTLSMGKTAVNPNWFSLNSTFFVAGTTRVRLAPVIRSTAIFKKPESISAIKGQFDTLRGFRGLVGERLRIFFLGVKRGAINGSQLSLTRGLGMKVSRKEIFASGLAERESFYLSLDKKFDELKEARPGYFRSAIPEGWRREYSTEKVNDKEQREFFRELVSLTWMPEVSEPTRGHTTNTVRFVPYPVKGARMLKFSGRNIHRRRTKFASFFKKKGTYRWVKSEVKSDKKECEWQDVSDVARWGIIKGEGFAIRCDTWQSYDYRVPPSTAFPSRYVPLG